MRLDILELDQNPWLEPHKIVHTLPSPRADGSATGTSSSSAELRSRQGNALSIKEKGGRRISETRHRFSVAPLGEYCLRVLLAPHQSQPSPTPLPQPNPFTLSEPSTSANTLDSPKPQQVPSWPHYDTNLQTYYDLPLSANAHYPPHFLDTLRTCLPTAVARPDTRTHLQAHTISPGTQMKKTRPSSLHEDIFSFPVPSAGPRPQTPPQRSVPLTSRMIDSKGNTRELASEEGGNTVFGICPSHKHLSLDCRVFTRNAEERFTWEDVIASTLR